MARDLDDFVKLRAQARLEEWDCRTTDEWLSLLPVNVEACNAFSSETNLQLLDDDASVEVEVHALVRTLKRGVPAKATPSAGSHSATRVADCDVRGDAASANAAASAEHS